MGSGIGHCEICRKKLKPYEETFLCLSCEQDYHLNCMRKALKYNSKCPMCRNQVNHLEKDNESLEEILLNNFDFNLFSTRVTPSLINESQEESRLKKVLEVLEFIITISSFYFLLFSVFALFIP